MPTARPSSPSPQATASRGHRLQRGDALLVVDVQRDFLPGGALGVPDGDAVVPILNRYIERFRAQALPIAFTRDWHPPDHCSFLPQGGPWPPHCVADSPGAAFAAALDIPAEAHIVSKATCREADAYSGFEGTHLADWLRQRCVRRVFVGGLATDYCVQATVRDALAAGFEAVVLADAIRAVEVQAGDGARALTAMQDAGARFADLDTLEASAA